MINHRALLIRHLGSEYLFGNPLERLQMGEAKWGQND